MRIACHLMYEFDALREATSGLADVELIEARNEQEVLRALPRAQALITFSHHYSPAVAERVNANPQVGWVHFVTAGVDPLWRSPPRADLKISNAGGVWAGTVAEHAIALTLALLRRLPQVEQNRAAASWGRAPLIDTLQTLAGRRVLLLGFGDIGRNIARRLDGFDAQITALARRERTEAGVAVHELARLEELLPQADVLIVAMPLSPDTHQLLDAGMLELLPRGACLVNIARGALIDEDALLAWLHAGHGQAALDVFTTEPLPAEHPLWSAPNLLITPHVAGFGDSRLSERIARAASDNLSDLLAGRTPRDAIDTSVFIRRATGA